MSGSDPTPSHRLVGVIETIRFQNINKAKGRFTYNVELMVRPSCVEPARDPPDSAERTIQVRIRQGMGWKSLRPGARAALAPEGPRQSMKVEAWAGHRVGEPIDMRVRFTSFRLAHPVPPS